MTLDKGKNNVKMDRFQVKKNYFYLDIDLLNIMNLKRKLLKKKKKP